MASDGAVVRIEETTVGDIDGWMVTVGNIMSGEWVDASGLNCQGLSAEIGLYDDERSPRGEPTVGAGAVLQIAGRAWRVDAVQAGATSADGGMSNGHVTLKLLVH